MLDLALQNLLVKESSFPSTIELTCASNQVHRFQDSLLSSINFSFTTSLAFSAKMSFMKSSPYSSSNFLQRSSPHILAICPISIKYQIYAMDFTTSLQKRQEIEIKFITNMQSQPIPLIQFEGEQFTITQQAKDFLSKMEGPLGVVTIVGKYRTGKSLFLNKVLLNNSDSFKVCPTINSCTKGLWISRQTIKSQHPECPDMDTIVIDTEGFGAMEQTDAYNNKILLFAMLLSSYFIYNSVGSIDQKSLNNLNIITNLAKQLQSKNISNNNFEEQFPTFMWLVRDFTLRLVDQNGFSIEPKEYLEHALEIQKGVSDATESKNKIRRMIKHFFKERDCFTMVTPVTNEEQLQKLNTLSDQEFRPQFLEQIETLRNKIVRKIKAKKLKNRKLTGSTFLELANSYITAINSGSLPNLQSAWKNINTFQNNQSVRKIKNIIEEQIKKFTTSIKSQPQFIEKQKQLISYSFEFLKKIIIDEKDLNLNHQKVKQYLSKSLQNARQKNHKNSYQMLVQKFYEDSLQVGIGFQNSLDQIQKKFNKLQKEFRDQFKQNPCLSQFISNELLPYKTQVLMDFAKKLIMKNDEQKQNTHISRQILESKLKESEQENKKITHDLFECQRELTFLKAKLEQQQKIKSLQLNYLHREVSELKNDLASQQAKNASLTASLRQKDLQIVQMTHQNQSFSTNAREMEDDRKLLKKQIQILNHTISSKVEEIGELKKNISQLSSALQKIQEREEGLVIRTKSEMQTKSYEYEQLCIKYEKCQQQLMDVGKKLAKAEATVEAQNIQIEKERNMYEQTLQILKENLQKQFQYRDDLMEANKNMAFALKHLQQRFDQAQEKQKKLKQYKKCFKNSSCMQCQNCSKFFVPTIFPQHLNVCILAPEILKNTENDKAFHGERLEILVKQTLLKDSDSKPFTEYVLEVHKQSKCWTIHRKYKALCDLHSQLKAMFPGVNLSEYSFIVSPQQGSKKSMLVEERRKVLQKYLKDLCCCPHVTQTVLWRQFIEDETQNTTMGHLMGSPNTNLNSSKLAISSLVKSNLIHELNSGGKQNMLESNMGCHKTPEQFLKIWNERNLRVKQISKAKRHK